MSNILHKRDSCSFICVSHGMIVVEGEKYACERCIRGHRSSTCKHINRALVLVRSRGRPITDSSQRIAIHAERVNDQPSCQCKAQGRGKKCSCASSHSNASVIVLKASKKQVFNVNKDSLKLLDPVMDIPTVESGLQAMAKPSPAGTGTGKGGKSCCSSKQQQPDSAPIPQIPGFIQFNPPKSPERLNSPLPSVGLAGTGQLFDMYYADSCVVPGSCLCDPDQCLCEGCIEHHLSKDNDHQSIKEMFNDFQFELNSINPSAIHPLGHIELKMEDGVTSICLCPDDECTCFNCDLHGIVGGVHVPKDQMVNRMLDDLKKFEDDVNTKSTCCSKTSKLKVTATEFPIIFNKDSVSPPEVSCCSGKKRKCSSSDPNSYTKPQKSCCSSKVKIEDEEENDDNTSYSKKPKLELIPLSFDTNSCSFPDDLCTCENCFDSKFTTIT